MQRLLVRWELFSRDVQADKAVRSVRVVKLDGVAASASGAPHVDPAQRCTWLGQRTQSYERRLAQD
jgi:hypothetical protein